MESKIKNIILKQLEFLINSGFKYTSKLRESDFDDELIEEIFFTNGFIQIEVNYDKLVNGSLLSIYIQRLNENKCFSLDEYLLSKSYNDYHSFSNENDEDYIVRIANIFYKETINELKDVLNGKKWIEVPKDYSRIR